MHGHWSTYNDVQKLNCLYSWSDYSGGISNYRVFEQSMLCKCFDLKQKYLINMFIFHILSSTTYILWASFVDITRHARGRGLLLKAEDARV